jgi:hypothetical protein
MGKNIPRDNKPDDDEQSKSKAANMKESHTLIVKL